MFLRAMFILDVGFTIEYCTSEMISWRGVRVECDNTFLQMLITAVAQLYGEWRHSYYLYKFKVLYLLEMSQFASLNT